MDKPILKADMKLDFPIVREGHDSITRALEYSFKGKAIFILATDYNVWCLYSHSLVGEFLPYEGQNFKQLVTLLYS